MALYDTYIALVEINGVWTPYNTSANVLREYTLVQDAIDAVKTTYGNSQYRIFQEYKVTKTDVPT